MRAIAGALLVMGATVAGAQPVPPTAPPAPQSQPQPFVPHAEYAVRVGMHDTELEYDDDAPAGRGLLVEAEAAWRFTPWLSLGAFGAFSRLSDSFHDPFEPRTYSATVTFVDLGLRFSVHAGGAFAGLGIAEEERHFGTWERGPLAEIHAGYTFPRIGVLHGAPQVMLQLGRSVDDYDYYIEIKRLSIGVQF